MEMQIKTTMRYHSLFVRMTVFKKTTQKKFNKNVEKRDISYIVGGNVIGAATVGNI